MHAKPTPSRFLPLFMAEGRPTWAAHPQRGRALWKGPSAGCRWLAVLTVVAAWALPAQQGDAGPPWPVLFSDDFQSGAERWQTTDVDRPFWKVIGTDHGKVFRVTGKSDYEPPHRSPHSIALVKDLIVGDFQLTAQVQSTDRQSGAHRDMCLFWGYQDPAHYYYVHLGARPDPHSCQIFIVNGAPRTKITTVECRGTPWTDGWHQVKVLRHVDDGSMKVYFDDMQRPLMVAEDKTFLWGQVGLGTFDNHGNWDDVVVRGIRLARPSP